jgi:adenylate cyclase
MAAALMCLLAVFVFQMSFGFFVESRGFREMTRLFAYYVPPELVEKMAQQPQAYSMAALEKTLTVMFVDVRDFTSTSEKLSPPQLAEWINAYLSEMSRVIKVQHQGTLDKYIGDAVMAFWGAPVSDHDHADNAVRAALDMQASARRLSEEFTARGWPPLAIGVGVNTGPMVVGDMGSNVRKAYTVMGDAVNLASRLEGLTKVYGVGVLMGQDTRQALQGWACREVDRVKVKGKDQAVAIYEPLCPESQLDAATRDELQCWNDVLGHYRQQAWGLAREGLLDLQQRFPERKLYALYLARIDALQREGVSLGDDWDGSTQFKTK